MMDFTINHEELAALYGLPHIQQLAYLRGIRPYMNAKTGMVGIERGISHQSIAEQLYIEPHQGIRSVSYSRAQIRRALTSLEQAGLIQAQSGKQQLILKCLLATRGFCVQKKAVTKPSAESVSPQSPESPENKGFPSEKAAIADRVKTSKADTPLKDNNYLYLFPKFEKFWSLYPLKASQPKAWEEFRNLQPDDALLNQILKALAAQIQNRKEQKLQGVWVPPWKYPANWLAQESWNDELTTTEQTHAKNTKPGRKKSAIDVLWESCTDVQFEFENDFIGKPKSANVLPFNKG